MKQHEINPLNSELCEILAENSLGILVAVPPSNKTIITTLDFAGNEWRWSPGLYCSLDAIGHSSLVEIVSGGVNSFEAELQGYCDPRSGTLKCQKTHP